MPIQHLLKAAWRLGTLRCISSGKLINRVKKGEAGRKANKRQSKTKDEEEAFLDWSDDDDGGFDPSTPPDPDKYRSSEESASEDMENKINDMKKKQGMRKRNNSKVEDVEDVGPASRNRKKEGQVGKPRAFGYRPVLSSG
ncbi:putative ATP-dependent RNA helicase DDX10 [Tupaia chinensis]|uniref:Putative ATP-dependent RNA helicase DDX10 n=1 Tax=Tupaia chinensis TaxID=246437 RepID=L9LCS3_TUPCH|nr:putative ATP-dependent RNA helicase DDX10 [Tupaia chinensis]